MNGALLSPCGSFVCCVLTIENYTLSFRYTFKNIKLDQILKSQLNIISLALDKLYRKILNGENKKPQEEPQIRGSSSLDGQMCNRCHFYRTQQDNNSLLRMIGFI